MRPCGRGMQAPLAAHHGRVMQVSINFGAGHRVNCSVASVREEARIIPAGAAIYAAL